MNTLSYTIAPNYALGMGVILTILKTFKDGAQMIVDEIPCQNRATAEYIWRHRNNNEVKAMVESFANH